MKEGNDSVCFEMHHYKIRYTLNGEPMSETIYSPGPVSALDKFHRSMQITSGVKPEEYEIISLGHVYNLDSTGAGRLQDVESRFDLPGSPNPNLLTRKVAIPAETEPFAFMASIPEVK